MCVLVDNYYSSDSHAYLNMDAYIQYMNISRNIHECEPVIYGGITTNVRYIQKFDNHAFGNTINIAIFLSVRSKQPLQYANAECKTHVVWTITNYSDITSALILHKSPITWYRVQQLV